MSKNMSIFSISWISSLHFRIPMIYEMNDASRRTYVLGNATNFILHFTGGDLIPPVYGFIFAAFNSIKNTETWTSCGICAAKLKVD